MFDVFSVILYESPIQSKAAQPLPVENSILGDAKGQRERGILPVSCKPYDKPLRVPREMHLSIPDTSAA